MQIANKFYDVIHIHGCAVEICHDHAAVFVGEVLTHLATLLQRKQNYNSGFMPIAQHNWEHSNATIANSLRCLVSEHHYTWVQDLAAYTFTYNTAPVPDTEGLSPYLIIHGHIPHSPYVSHLAQVQPQLTPFPICLPPSSDPVTTRLCFRSTPGYPRITMHHT